MSKPALCTEPIKSSARSITKETRMSTNERTSAPCGHEQGDKDTTFAEPSHGQQHQLGPRAQGEHLFHKNEAHEDADFFGGDYYAGEIPAGAKGHNFVENHARGNSTIHAGNTDAASRIRLMQEKEERRLARMKAKGKE